MPTPGPIPERHKWAYSICHQMGFSPTSENLGLLTWLKEAAEKTHALEQRVIRLETAVTSNEISIAEAYDCLRDLEHGPEALVPPNKPSLWVRLRNLL